jgi:tRNA threonylcarbamoyladenosine biosynthesis protein TsaB
VELAIDTAGEAIGVCVSDEGRPVAVRWTEAGHRHTAGLIPEVEAVLREAGIRREELRAVFVCVGPGGYTGLRSGISAAKGIAVGLDLPIVGVGRFEAEVWRYGAKGPTLVAVHHAGRDDYAWQVFEQGEPRGPAAIGTADDLIAAIPAGAAVIGEVDEALRGRLGDHKILATDDTGDRPSSIARIGWRRFQSGGHDDPAALAPLYLREPAIGPQKKRGENGA